MKSNNVSDAPVHDREHIEIYWFEGEVVRAVQVGPDLRNVGAIIGWIPLYQFSVTVREHEIELRDMGRGICETLRPSDWLVRHGPEGWGVVEDSIFRLVYSRSVIRAGVG